MGNTPDAVPVRIRRGEPIDVVIMRVHRQPRRVAVYDLTVIDRRNRNKMEYEKCNSPQRR